MNLVWRPPAPPAQICCKLNCMAAPISTNRFSAQPRSQTSAVPLAEPTSSSEAGAQVEPQTARWQLVGGLAERAVGHVRVDTVEVAAVKQVEDFTLGFDLHLFRKEPRNIEVFLEG